MPILAMVDPLVGAAGGVIAMCLFGVGPVALIAHFYSRRFFLVTFALTGLFTLFMFLLWLFFALTSSRGANGSIRLVWVGFIFSFGVSLVAGIPAALYRSWRCGQDED